MFTYVIGIIGVVLFAGIARNSGPVGKFFATLLGLILATLLVLKVFLSMQAPAVP
jgi:hypothetical protein